MNYTLSVEIVDNLVFARFVLDDIPAGVLTFRPTGWTQFIAAMTAGLAKTEGGTLKVVPYKVVHAAPEISITEEKC